MLVRNVASTAVVLWPGFLPTGSGRDTQVRSGAHSRHPLLEAPARDPLAPGRTADAGDAEGGRLPGGDRVPGGTHERVPRRRPQGDVPALVSGRGAPGSGARLRERDLARAAEAHAEGGLRARRPHRAIGRRGGVRQASPRHGWYRGGPRRLPRSVRTTDSERGAHVGRQPPAHDRRLAATRRRARAAMRHRTRTRGRRVGRQRRLDRRPRSQQRRHPRDGLVPHLPGRASTPGGTTRS